MSQSGCGGIGRHARFRFSYREVWGFESLHPHQKEKIKGCRIAYPENVRMKYGNY